MRSSGNTLIAANQTQAELSDPVQSRSHGRSWWARRDYGFHVFMLLCLGWILLGLFWWWVTHDPTGLGISAAGAGMAAIALGFSVAYDHTFGDQ